MAGTTPKRWERWLLGSPWIILALAGVVSLVAIALGSQVEFRSSRSELAPPGDPDQIRWEKLLDDYGSAEYVVACVEREPTADGSTAPIVEELATAFRRLDLIDSIYYKLNLDWIDRNLIFLTPTAQLDGLSDAGLDDLGPIDAISRVNGYLDERFVEGLESGSLDDADNTSGLDVMLDMLRWQRRWLEAPPAAAAEFMSRDRMVDFLGDRLPFPDGYLQSRDGGMYFLILSTSGQDDLPYRRQLMAALQAEAATVMERFPDARIGFTGRPAIVVEEMDTIRGDTLKTSIVAVVGVGLLTLLVFRWKTHALIVMSVLMAGVLWSFGAVRLELGYLNMITSSFISTLVGVGVAYGIHPVSEYELLGAHTRDPHSTIVEAFRRTGGAVLIAAITTSAAFFSILFMNFRGFAELGLVAGFGVLLCLVATLAVLPAALLIYARRRGRTDRGERGGAVVDRWWVDRLASRATIAPRTISLVALVVTALMAWQASQLEFQTNLFRLLPRDAESIRLQERMADESDLTPLYNLVPVTGIEELRELRERTRGEEDIARFQSILDYLPEDPAAARHAAAALAGTIDGLQIEPEAPDRGADALAASYESLEERLAEAADIAFGGGLADLAVKLEEAREIAEENLERVEAFDETAWQLRRDEEVRMLRHARVLLMRLRDYLSAAPPTLDSLPEDMRSRFVTRSGLLLGFLYAEGDVFETDRLNRYIAASKRISPEATGFPLVFHKMASRITSGFSRAVAFGALMVLVILLVDFRSPRDALLAALPLAMGSIWMMGAMKLLGLGFNFANLVGVPLIIGVGIDNGVHIMRRVRLEGDRGMDVVARHTGRAILIASLTTMIGFGSLGLASHRGLASLGIVLLIGVFACWLTSTIVLPNVLVALGRVRR